MNIVNEIMTIIVKLVLFHYNRKMLNNNFTIFFFALVAR